MKKLVIPVILLTLLLFASEAQAQRFGARQMGNSLVRKAKAGAKNAGLLSGAERFMRANRRGNHFIGVDNLDHSGFVGMQQATSNNRQVRNTVRKQKTNRGINPRRRPRKPNDMYEPRLEVNGLLAAPAVAARNRTTVVRLSQMSSLRSLGSIAVSVEGQTATLSGLVSSDRDRVLAAQYVSLEPGIWNVKNDLVVKPQ